MSNTVGHRTQISTRETARYGRVVEARVIIDPGTRKSVSRAFRTGSDAERMVAAEKWISDTIQGLQDGTTPETAVQRRTREQVTRATTPEVKGWTLGTWTDHTLATNTRRAENTREQYAAAIRRHFDPLRALPLTSITPELIESRAAELVADGAGPVSVRRSLAALSGVMQDAVRRRLIPWNPVRTATVPDQAGAKRRPAKALSGVDLAALLVVADDPDRTDKMTRAAARMLVSTGLRRSELVALEWSDVTLTKPDAGPETATLSVKKATTLNANGGLRTATPKTPRSIRTITVQGPAVAALRAWRAAQRAEHMALGVPVTHVFTREGSQLRPDLLSDLVARMAKAAGLPHLTAHSLRHTSGTRLIDAGADLTAVSRRLGHASVRTTEAVYVHELQAREQTLAALAAEAIG